MLPKTQLRTCRFVILFSLRKKPPQAVLRLSSPSTLESLVTGCTTKKVMRTDNGYPPHITDSFTDWLKPVLASDWLIDI